MRLYIDAKTNVKHVEELAIDYIEVRLKNGKNVSLNWNESDFTIEDGTVYSTYKGVYFDEEYADGRIQELEDMKIVEVKFYSEADKPLDFIITNMQFEDYDKELSFLYPYVMINDIPITDKIFDIHVNYGDKDREGYSIFVSTVMNKQEAVDKAVKNVMFEEPEDINRIDYVEEISLEEFLEIKGFDFQTIETVFANNNKNIKQSLSEQVQKIKEQTQQMKNQNDLHPQKLSETFYKHR